MVLTLRTPEGMATSNFTIKRWQLQGMATVATCGSTREPWASIDTLTFPLWRRIGTSMQDSERAGNDR